MEGNRASTDHGEATAYAPTFEVCEPHDSEVPRGYVN